MPSRRAVLAGAGGMFLAGSASSVAWSRSVGTGQLYQKTVYVTDERHGNRYAFNVANLLYADSSQEVMGEIVEEFADVYQPPLKLQISSEIHEEMTDRFEEVSYLLTFEKNSRITGGVSRSDFNRVSLGDEVDVLEVDWLDVAANNHIVGATGVEPPVSDVEVRIFPLTEAYPE